MANHEKNFAYYFLYRFNFAKRLERGSHGEIQTDYFSARGTLRAVERFRKSYPYEEYVLLELDRVISYRDLKAGENPAPYVR